MKNIFKVYILFFVITSYSQNFNGDYRSYKTSFEDFSSTKNNFIEETEFRIAVFINKNGTDGDIIIQDPRIPKKLLAYKVMDYIGKLEDDGIISYLYKCKTEHLESTKEVILTFYFPIDKKLSLMVSDENSSQVFFDLMEK
tara:strand:- start:271 stop:693 length:423 start_codon:yes stop_codon:yes gene_type:complete